MTHRNGCNCECWKYFNCVICGACCTEKLVTKCDVCFERGKEISPPRQSGRTMALLRKLDENPEAVLVVRFLQVVQGLKDRYWWLKNRIIQPDQVSSFSRGANYEFLYDAMF